MSQGTKITRSLNKIGQPELLKAKYINRPVLLWLLAFVLTLNSLNAQSYFLEGHVYDRTTKEPLRFVNIVINNTQQGGTSDIDGRFRLQSHATPDSLVLSYVGYETYIHHITKSRGIEIFLEPSEITLSEVVILPGENPAHRIIDSVYANRDRNNPVKRASFEYKSHNKLSFAIDTGALRSRSARDTTINQKTIESLEKNYLLLIESITHRKFMFPAHDNEVVLASKVSGIKDPIFSLLASQLQTFSFYDDHIAILDKRFLNPISRNSTNRYLFILEDTTFTAASDTVYIISYRPRLNRNFDGLKGLLYINTNGYAIQNVTATPAEGNISNFDINIRQAYELVDDTYWFPSQLNTELTYVYPDAIDLKIIGEGRSYIRDIKIDGKMHRRDFSNIAFEIESGASERDDDFWNYYRYEPLSEKDMETYRLLDSLSQGHDFDRLSNLLRALLEGKIPIGFVNLDIARLVNFNNYNGWRLGLGLETNRRVSRFFNVGGYFAYSTRTDAWRYGAHARLNIDRRNDIALTYNFVNDDMESAPLNAFAFVPRLELNNYRSYIISVTDNTIGHRGAFSFRPYKYLLANLSYTYSELSPNFKYKYVQRHENINILSDHFTFSEIGLNLRFAFRESFILVEDYKMSLGTRFPIVNIGIKQGLEGFHGGDFEYTRLDFDVDYSYYYRVFGHSRVILQGGLIMGDLPYSKLYNGCGSYEDFTIYSPFTFSTMRLNEFLADRYVALLFRHSFGSLLFSRNNFKPELVVVSNFCIGSLSNKKAHREIDFNTVEKGYFESGIVINDLIRPSFYGLGVAAFYRYGSHAFSEPKDNLALQMSLKITL